MNTLRAPEVGVDLGDPIANDYFRGRGNFIPTDVEQQDGMFYMTTGYRKFDFVLHCRFHPLDLLDAILAFAGRGTGPGQFGTGHGITIPPGTSGSHVATGGVHQ